MQVTPGAFQEFRHHHRPDESCEYTYSILHVRFLGDLWVPLGQYHVLFYVLAYVTSGSNKTCLYLIIGVTRNQKHTSFRCSKNWETPWGLVWKTWFTWLFAHLATCLIEIYLFSQGFERVYEFMPDIAIDVPAAYAILERFVIRCRKEGIITDELVRKMPSRSVEYPNTITPNNGWAMF